MTFSEKLQRLRKVNGLSQEQLAEKLNVSRQAISKWEMGAIPDMDNVIQISRFFDCSLDYLMNNEAEETSIKPFPSQAAPQKTAKKKNHFHIIVAGIISGLGAIGLLIIGILSSVYPAVIYDPPQGEVRAIVATGFTAFLKLHNITWLFILCCALVICGVVIMLLNIRKKGT